MAMHLLMEEIAKELLETVQWLTTDDLNSKWYMEYLDKVNLDLKAELFFPVKN